MTNDSNTQIASQGGNLDDPHSGVVALRQLADAHAAKLAGGERKIANLTHSFRVRFLVHITERIQLEKRQCEMLLRMEEDISHGQRTQWKWELSLSLQHVIGARYSVTGIEERLTAARRAKIDPGYWTQLSAACLSMDTINFRKAHRALKPRKEEDEENESQTAQGGDGGDGGDVEDEEGGDEDEDEDTTASAARDDEPDMEIAAVLVTDLRAENDDLRAEVERLRVEVEQLRKRLNEVDHQSPLTVRPQDAQEEDPEENDHP